MKKLLLILLCLPMIGFGQVVPMGEGVYSVSETGSTGFVSTGTLRKRCIKAANEYATQKEATIEVISFVDKHAIPLSRYPQVDLTFRLVSDTTKETVPNHPNAGTIIKKNDDKYDKLKKLGQLRADGILTEEEFLIEKKKILSDE